MVVAGEVAAGDSTITTIITSTIIGRNRITITGTTTSNSGTRLALAGINSRRMCMSKDMMTREVRISSTKSIICTPLHPRVTLLIQATCPIAWALPFPVLVKTPSTTGSATSNSFISRSSSSRILRRRASIKGTNSSGVVSRRALTSTQISTAHPCRR